MRHWLPIAYPEMSDGPAPRRLLAIIRAPRRSGGLIRRGQYLNQQELAEISKMRRRAFLMTGMALGGSQLGGCLTRRMQQNRERYIEFIDAVLISQDQSKLVVIGKNHHYIFDAPPSLVHLLGSDLHTRVQASFRTFRVESDNTITGSLELLLPYAGPSARQEALTIGFEPDGPNALLLRLKLKGERFAARGALPANNSYKLSKGYSVFVEEADGIGSTAMKVALTPVTVVADGLLYLGIALVVIPILILSQ